MEILGNGSLRSEGGVRLDYGQFCFQPLAGKTKSGRYSIKTNIKKEAEEETENDFKFTFYPIILSISIVCLFATISIYIFFHKSLLKSDHNKIMVNFAGSLLVAFLTLVVMQHLEGDEQTKAVCTFLTLSNQFSFISAFCLLTLMSHRLFSGIHWMTTVRDQGRGRFLKEVVFCYSLPAALTLVTLIVEVTAPRCAPLKPMFGER